MANQMGILGILLEHIQSRGKGTDLSVISVDSGVSDLEAVSRLADSAATLDDVLEQLLAVFPHLV